MNSELRMSEEESKLRARLQEAVRIEEVPPFLEARIRAHIHSAAAPHRRWHRGWTIAMSSLTLLVGAGVAYQLGHLRFTEGSQESYVAAMGNRVASIMRIGLSNHLHCAYFAKPSKTQPKMEQFIRDMGPKYAGLVPVVRKHVSGPYRLEAAHRCSYQGRIIVHLVLKHDSQLISLVVAKKAPGESFEVSGLLPALKQSGLSFYRASAQKYELASFESRDFLVFLISDLPGQANADQLLAMAPEVREVLAQLEL